MPAQVIGRGREQEGALSALASGAVVAITGPAGVGKSSLVEALARSVERDGGHAVLLQAAAPARHVALAGLGDLVDPADREAFGAEPGPDRAVAALAAGVVERHRPTVILIDEAQFLDDASRAVVRRWLATRPCGLAFAWRSGALEDTDLLADLAGPDTVSIRLGALAEEDMSALVERTLGGVAARSLVRTLHDTTQGNPMLAIATLRHWREDHVLAVRDGVWQVVGTPGPLGDLVDEAQGRLARLSEEERAALLAVCLAEPVELGLALDVCREEALERLEHAGLLAVDRAGRVDRVRVTHPTISEAMLGMAGRDEVAATCRALALAAGATDSVPMIQRGTWLLRSSAGGAGADPAAADVLVAAAEDARRFSNHALAVELATAAVASGANVRGGLVLAEVDIFAGRWAQADSRLSGLAREASSDDEMSMVANAHAYVLGQLGRGSRAAEVLAEASARIADEAARGRLRVRAAIGQVFAGNGVAALRTVEGALADADPRVRGQALYTAALGHALVGDVAEAVGAGEAGVAVLTGVVPTPEVPRLGAALAGILAPDRALAAAHAGIYLDSCVRAGDAEGEATGSLLKARADLLAGDVATARAEFQRSLAASRSLDDVVAVRWALAGVAHCAAMLGGVAEARALLAELDGMGPAPVRIHEADIVLRARAYVAAAAGDCAAAIDDLVAEAGRCAVEGQPAVADLLARDALLLALDDTDLRRRAVDGVRAIAWPASTGRLAQRVGEVVATMDPPQLSALHDHLIECGADLDAAIVALSLARLEARAGTRPARRWQARAHLAAAIHPWRATAGAGPAVRSRQGGPRLTQRQLEIARAAADGHSSATIANDLSLSVRTVENHLQAIYREHGLRSRVELSELLARGD